ncbi:MAG: invasin domain 3-containing protein, partial [Candidatus Neomarinimicrobiota bacterium]
MIRNRLLSWSVLLSLLLTVQCTVDSDNITGPSDEPDKYIVLKSLTASKNQVFTQGDQAIIALTVANADDQPPDPGIAVKFTAQLGQFATSTDTTDTGGVARATYISGDVPGVDKIFASTGIKTDSLLLYLVNQAADLQLTASATAILGDGVTTATITASARDDADQPLANMRIYFNSDHGQITASGTTAGDGTVQATLTSVADSLDVVTVVRAAFEPFTAATAKIVQSVPNVSKVAEREFRTAGSKKMERMLSNRRKTILEKPTTAPIPQTLTRTTAGLYDSLTVTFRGITILLQKNKSELLANGEDLANITITVYETTTGNPVTNHSFTATTTRGTVLGDSRTDGSGRATIQLRSGTVPGTATVNVTIGGTLISSTKINFISTYPTHFSLSQSDHIILADGQSAATITALVIDTLGNPVQGAGILISSDLGDLEYVTTITNADGEVEVDLISLANKTDMTATVRASVVGYPRLADSVTVDFKGITLSAYANDNLLVANGINTTTVTAVVFQTSTNSAVAGRPVYFSTSLGTIASPVTSSSSGVAATTLTSGIFPGLATIVVRFGDLLTDTLTVEYLSSGANNLVLARDQEAIRANGKATTTISATVTDTLGDPVSGTLVNFSTGAGTLSNLYATSDVDGIALVVLTGPASVIDLTTTVRASVNTSLNRSLLAGNIYDPALPTLRYTTASGPIRPRSAAIPATAALNDSVQVSFKGITVDSYATDQAIVADGSSHTTIIATVRETSTNIPVQDETVLFSTNLGTISGALNTSASGVASGTLTSGLIAGTARVIIRYGATLYDTTTVDFFDSEPDQFTLELNPATVLADGQATLTLTALILDTLDNPVTSEAVSFSTTLGSLSAATALTDEDGFATVTLTGTARASDTTVTVKSWVTGYPELVDSVTTKFRGLTMSTQASDLSITADGSSMTDIIVTLYETSSHSAIPNQIVRFATNLGTITNAVATDINGIASATLTSGILAGTASVFVSTGDVHNDTIQIGFLNHNPHHISIAPDAVSILADGSSGTVITAQVLDTLDNPVAGAAVNFTSDNGQLDRLSGITDGDGYIYTTLTGLPDSLDRTAKVLGSVTYYAGVKDSVEISLRGMILNISADPTRLPANGYSTSVISISLRESGNGNPVTGRAIALGTNRGTIISTVTTNSMGTAETELTSNTTPGTATITATAGISKTTTVEFLPIIPKDLSMIVAATSLLANGSAITNLTATVMDTLGNPVNNALLSFSSDAGTLSKTLTPTNTSGQATVTLTSTASSNDLTAQVICKAFSYPTVTDTVEVGFRGITLTIGASPQQIPANGSTTATITAGLQETTNGNPLTGTTVFWGTSLGVIPASSVTNSLGFATATLTSGITSGTATITATAGVSKTTTVELLPVTPSVIAVSVSATSIIADRAATSTISATVSDVLGNPVSGTLVNFATAVGTLSSASATTGTSGLAQVILTSPARTSDTTAAVTATVAAYPAVNTSTGIEYRGLTLTASADPNQIPANGNAVSSILAILTETTNGNPVVSKILAVSTDRGSIPAQGITGTNGKSTIILTAGTSAGTATITVKAGVTATTTVDFISTAPTAVVLIASASSILADQNDSSILTATVTDALDNPVSGKTVNFTISNGTVANASGVTNGAGLAVTTVTGVAGTIDQVAEAKAVLADYSSVRDSLDIDLRGVT